jgi:hypothetical protein
LVWPLAIWEIVEHPVMSVALMATDATQRKILEVFTIQTIDW